MEIAKTLKKRLLFVNQWQFGYHIDYVQYCKYLKNDFDITFLCWDYKIKKLEESDINIIYISRDGNIFKRNIHFIRSVIRFIAQHNFDFIFIHYFRGVSLISFLSNRKKQPIHLDIRSGAISYNKLRNILYNANLKIESLFFNSVSIISEGLRKKLRVNKNSFILPLGANPIDVNRRTNNKIHLLYVGTFVGRHIEDTIEGVGLYLKSHPEADIFYTIIGDGSVKEKNELEKRILKYGLQKHINLEGYVAHSELSKFYQTANVGISYIPLTSFYEYQPATKTFEYLMAGMPVIATGTYENKKIVNDQNGLFIDDNPLSFADSLKLIYNKIEDFNESIIRESVAEYKWESIVKKLKDYILSVCDVI